MLPVEPVGMLGGMEDRLAIAHAEAKAVSASFQPAVAEGAEGGAAAMDAVS